MTAPQKDVRRIAAIIAALDSTAISEIEVFVLTYADARSVAAELKEAFQSADAEVIRANPRRFGRGVAAGFNPADGGAGADPNSKNAQTHAVFVSDEQMNAVIASAPPGAMPMITNVIAQLDKPSQDITEIEIFPLQHADPTEIADQISALFAAPAGTSDQNSRTAGFQFGPPGMASPSSGRANESNRLKRQASVCAVADRRTQSVAITASRTSMTTIRGLIAKWDEGDKDMRFVSIFPIDSADPAVMQAAVGALFGGSQNQPALQTPLSLRPGNTAGSQSPATGPAGGLGFGSGSGAGAR
jgi:type II secretory pathway component GspD/PulD (secretin)